MSWRQSMYRQELRAQIDVERRRKRNVRKKNKMKIKLDNLDDHDGCVMVTCEDKVAAELDQTVAGARWECPADMDTAYAMPIDHAGLADELRKEGYELDLDEYCPPD